MHGGLHPPHLSRSANPPCGQTPGCKHTSLPRARLGAGHSGADYLWRRPVPACGATTDQHLHMHFHHKPEAAAVVCTHMRRCAAVSLRLLQWPLRWHVGLWRARVPAHTRQAAATTRRPLQANAQHSSCRCCRSGGCACILARCHAVLVWCPSRICAPLGGGRPGAPHSILCVTDG